MYIPKKPNPRMAVRILSKLRGFVSKSKKQLSKKEINMRASLCALQTNKWQDKDLDLAVKLLNSERAREDAKGVKK